MMPPQNRLQQEMIEWVLRIKRYCDHFAVLVWIVIKFIPNAHEGITWSWLWTIMNLLSSCNYHLPHHDLLEYVADCVSLGKDSVIKSRQGPARRGSSATLPHSANVPSSWETWKLSQPRLSVQQGCDGAGTDSCQIRSVAHSSWTTWKHGHVCSELETFGSSRDWCIVQQPNGLYFYNLWFMFRGDVNGIHIELEMLWEFGNVQSLATSWEA